MPNSLVYQSRAGDTVDSIAYMAYGATLGVTEAILEANPGLADFGPVLPVGVEIYLPEIDQPKTERVRLWD